MVLGKLSGPGRPTIWTTVGQGPTALAVGSGGGRGGRVVRWCWVNLQCRGVLLIWIRVGQGPTALAVGAGGGCLDIFSLVYRFSLLSPSLWETARYRLKYCLKGPLSPKQSINQSIGWRLFGLFYSLLSFLSIFSLSLGDGPI